MLKTVVFFTKRWAIAVFSGKRRTETFFGLGGVVLAVAVLTIAVALFEGYQQVLKDTILSANSHVYVFRNGPLELSQADYEFAQTELESNPKIECYSPIIRGEVMAAANNQLAGAVLRGIDWQDPNPPAAYRKFVTTGDWPLQQNNTLVIGSGLAKKLKVKVGDTITVTNPARAGYTPTGIKTARRKFSIGGIYNSGMYQYDSVYLFSNRQTAAEFTSTPGSYNMIEIKLKPEFIDDAAVVAYRLGVKLGANYQVRSWQYYNSSLFALLELEKWMLFVILSALVLIASFNIVSTSAAEIVRNRQEIGILKALGASNRTLSRVYLSRTLLASCVAISLGIALGILLARLATVQTLMPLEGEVYFIDHLSVSLNPVMLGLVFGVSLLLTAIAGILPLGNIKKLNVVEIVRG